MSGTDPRPRERIAVGVDGSMASHSAVRWALEHARDGDTVTLVHAWQPSPVSVETGLIDPEDDSGARRLIEHELARFEALPREPGVSLTAETVKCDPREYLCAPHADLVVVGAGGHGRLAGAVLGSVSAHLAHHHRVPLVIVPSTRSGGYARLS